jgi:thiaminase/transcriptional activator TenA
MTEAIAGTRYLETLTPLVVFEWLYNAWAAAVADRRPEKFYHREWIALHANPAFDSFVAWLRAQLDRDGPTLVPERQDRIVAVFHRTVALEKAFFDDAYAAE